MTIRVSFSKIGLFACENRSLLFKFMKEALLDPLLKQSLLANELLWIDIQSYVCILVM